MTSPQPIEIKHKTNETDIRLKLLLDGERKVQMETGIGFFDHLLQPLAFWAGWDLELSCKGDLHVDTHHTVEDVALALGQAFARAREDDAGDIERFGTAWVPMDEALSQVVVDLSDRPCCVFKADIGIERVGTFETVMTGHFFRSFAAEARITLHVRTLYGEDPHHIIESMFKGLGLALRQALRQSSGQALTPGPGGVASTKGALLSVWSTTAWGTWAAWATPCIIWSCPLSCPLTKGSSAAARDSSCRGWGLLARPWSDCAAAAWMGSCWSGPRQAGPCWASAWGCSCS